MGKPCAIIDCFCILDDDQIRRYFELGCEVKGMGRGHVKRIKDSVRPAGSRRMNSEWNGSGGAWSWTSAEAPTAETIARRHRRSAGRPG